MTSRLEVENAELRARIAATEKQVERLTAPRPASELDALSAAQTRADSVAAQFGTTAAAPVPGESAVAYLRRLAGHFQRHSPTFADVRLDRVDATALAPIEDGIYREAVAKANDPACYAPGELREIKERDSAGRLITRYVGDPMGWMAAFIPQGVAGHIVRNPPPTY